MDRSNVKDLSLDDLTEKQRRFVEAYTGEAQGNGTRAARLAGYAGNDVTLDAVARENLGKPRVAEAIRSALEPIRKAAIMTRERRQELLSKFAEGQVPGTFEEDDEPAFVPVKDRIKAIEVLGKMQGDFIEKREVTVTNGVTVYIPDNGRDPDPE